MTMAKNLRMLGLKNIVTHMGIQQEFSSPITPQQNGVVERKKHSFTRNGSSNDSLSKSCSTFLGRSYQYCMSYHQ
jgi:hypothetical protein